MKDEKSVRFRQEQVSAFSGNNCPLSSGFSVRNRRNMQLKETILAILYKRNSLKRHKNKKYTCIIYMDMIK